MVEEQKAEAPQALEWLFSEHLLPFELSAHRVEPIGSEEYIVRFHDSRLRSVDISWHQGQCFKDVFPGCRFGTSEKIERPFAQESAP